MGGEREPKGNCQADHDADRTATLPLHGECSSARVESVGHIGVLSEPLSDEEHDVLRGVVLALSPLPRDLAVAPHHPERKLS